MKKAYLLVYSDATGTKEAIKGWANGTDKVVTWRTDLPNCFYLISENSAEELSDDLQEKVGTTGRWLIMEVVDNRQGRLPSEAWYLMRNKQHKPK